MRLHFEGYYEKVGISGFKSWTMKEVARVLPSRMRNFI